MSNIIIYDTYNVNVTIEDGEVVGVQVVEGFIHDVIAGSNISIDKTDPLNPVISSTSSGGGAWGSITGTLSSQTDLQTALDAKISKSGTNNITGDLYIYDPTQTYNFRIGQGIGNNPAQILISAKDYAFFGRQALQYLEFNAGNTTLKLGSDATGDIYYRNSSGYLTRLAAGTDGHVLTLASGIPSWAAPSGGGSWGSITGTLSSQTDLQTALDDKFSLTNGGTLASASVLLDGDGNTFTINNVDAFTLGATASLDFDAPAFTFSNGPVSFEAGTTSYSSLKIPHGTAPSSPVDGDLWSTTSGFFGRVNGSTVGPFGTGGWALTGTSTLTGAVDIVGSSSNTLKHTFAGLGTTQTDGAGLHFRNTTAAAAGAQQYSPRVRLVAQGFATTPAASRTVEWVAEVQPVQQTTGPSNRLVFKGQVNGTGFADMLVLSHDPNVNGNRVGISNGLVVGSTSEADMSEFQIRVRGPGGSSSSNLTSVALNLPAAGNILWANTTDGWNGTKDLTLRRLTTASIVQGAANNATPVANFFTIGESSRGGTDSNVAGANGTVQSGLGTGTGALSTLILRSPIAAASGTTAQTYATGLTVVGGTAKMTSYTVAALPAAATVGAGARAFVTDALTPVFGSAVTGGGAVGVPVYSDGSTWLVG